MSPKFGFLVGCLVGLALLCPTQGITQEDKMAELAIATVKSQMRLPRDVDIKFIEKRESALPDFYAVKLLLSTPDRDIPMVIYVDKSLEKVIIGNLFIKGENVTRKEAGEPKIRKIDMGLLEIEKSPHRGPAEAKVIIVEFSNFECSYCIKAWHKMKEFLEKYPREIRYIFKHFPLRPQGKSFDLSVTISAAQEVSNEAFWLIHDFMFTDEGQAFIKLGQEAVKQKAEQILRDNGYDVQAYQNALEKGKGKKRVDEDIAVGRKIRVQGTPTAIINGSFVVGPLTDDLLKGHLKN